MLSREVRTVKLTSPSAVRELLWEHGIRPNKELGQHFLCDEHVLNKAIAAARLSRRDLVIEPGAGLGTLTLEIAARAGRVIAVELDAKLVSILNANAAASRLANVEVIHQDFLRLDLAGLIVAQGARQAKIMGNLPYGITSLVLEKLMAERERLALAVLMVQEELAEKLIAPPGPRASALGIRLRSIAEVKLLAKVPRTVFLPRPEVDSAIIKLTFLNQPRFNANEEVFSKAVWAAFNLRRKTIRQALICSPHLLLPREAAAAALQEAGIDPRRRGESLSVEEFGRLAQAIEQAQDS